MLTMDKSYINEHDIDQKYLRGQLSPEESQAFENYLMDDEALVEQLELDTLITQALPEAVVRQAKQSTPWWAFMATPLRASLLTFAVCLLVFPFGYKLLFAPQEHVIANIPMVYLAPARGAQTPAALIKLKSSDRYFELSVEVADRNATRYRIEITNKTTGEQLLAPREFEVMSSREIKLILPSGDYAAGDYQLTATPVGSGGKVEVFYFGVELE